MILNTNKQGENWIQYAWRPAMAWVYMVICVFDFIIAPVLTGVFYIVTKGTYVPWEPLTLKEGGFFHITMGAVTGVSAWTRGQEKLKRIDVDPGDPTGGPPGGQG